MNARLAPLAALLLLAAPAAAAAVGAVGTTEDLPDTVHAVRVLPPLRVRPVLRATPPLRRSAQPAGEAAREREERERGERAPTPPIGVPEGQELAPAPPSPVAPTSSARRTSAGPPGGVVVLRDSPLLGGQPDYGIAEPSTSGQGGALLNVHNFYAELSPDDGATWQYVDPDSLFPHTPDEYSAGVFGDQRVAQDGSRDLVFWLLQYQWPASGGSNGDRLVVLHGRQALDPDESTSWDVYDLTPAALGVPGRFFDFPHLQASANYLWFTTNTYDGAGSFLGALVARFPLAQLAAGGPLSGDVFLTSAASLAPVNGAQGEGVRVGLDRMWLGGLSATGSLRVFRWLDAEATPTLTTFTGLGTTTGGAFQCPGPDGRNPCSNATTRVQTGWVRSSGPGALELGFMWASAQNATTRPFPYTRVLLIDASTMTALGQPDIWSPTSAWLFPAVAVDERGYLGGTVDNLGGDVLPTMRLLVRDDLSPDVMTSGWETYAVATSPQTGADFWGDFNGAAVHERYPRTWLAAGHVHEASTHQSQIHHVWFARPRDARFTLRVSRDGDGEGTVKGTAGEVDCGLDCSEELAMGASVELVTETVPGSRFVAWGGACTGNGACVVTLGAGDAEVSATFALDPFGLGFAADFEPGNTTQWSATIP